MNTYNEPQTPAAPAFTPQPAPPGLGVLRTIVLILMVIVGSAELLLIAGVALGLFSML